MYYSDEIMTNIIYDFACSKQMPRGVSRTCEIRNNICLQGKHFSTNNSIHLPENVWARTKGFSVAIPLTQMRVAEDYSYATELAMGHFREEGFPRHPHIYIYTYIYM